jgi:hypothetical protein
LRGRPNSTATSLGALAALAGAVNDQVALELGEPAQRCQDQPRVRRRGISPGIAERLKAAPSLPIRSMIRRRSSVTAGPVCHDQHVASRRHPGGPVLTRRYEVTRQHQAAGSLLFQRRKTSSSKAQGKTILFRQSDDVVSHRISSIGVRE